MKRYMSATEYCQETGLPRGQLDKLIHSEQADEFSFRSGKGRTSPIYIVVPVFEKKLDRGDFKEILEG